MLKVFIGVNHRAFAVFAAALLPFFAAAAEQVEVHGDSASYSADGRRAEFDGNVELSGNGVTIYAARLVVSVLAEGNHYRISGVPARAECGDCAAVSLQLLAPEIILRDGETKMFTADGGLTLCAGESCASGQLIAGRAEWQRTSGKVLLQGAPVNGFWHPEDGGEPVTVRAEEISYVHVSGEILLRGGALLARGGEEIRGESIMFNIKTGAIGASGGDQPVRGVFGSDAQ